MQGNHAVEWQFDGLVGPTHNYAGLSYGNVASEKHAGTISNPLQAALQGVEKMRFVRQLGMKQAFLPPQKRPVISILQQLGFGAGYSREALAKTLESAHRQAPHLLASAFSASCMWAANAATVSPSSDTADGKLHLTPANLVSNLHRSLEGEATTRALRKIFHNESLFVVHNPLPCAALLSDEGAANHMRVCENHGNKGIEIFVYGAGGKSVKKTTTFPARQQWEASQAVARRHGLSDDHILYVQQHPEAIDQGVFHHDVIGMNTTRLMIAHEKAVLDKETFIGHLKRMLGEAFTYLEISDDALPLAEAVKSYFFNSQLLYVPGKGFVLLAPVESQESEKTHALLRHLSEENGVLSQVHYLNVRESMRNGGGPACLRLRVAMTEVEGAAIHPGVVLTDAQDQMLEAWIKRHYRDRLSLADFTDLAFIDELNTAYSALEAHMEMPGLYPERA